MIAGLLAIMAIGTLAHGVSSARRRRRELAIFKVLGFRRRQVSAAIGWQAAVTALIALVIGVPLGIGLGRWRWQVFARQLGVPDQPVTPFAAILAVAGLAIRRGDRDGSDSGAPSRRAPHPRSHYAVE